MQLQGGVCPGVSLVCALVHARMRAHHGGGGHHIREGSSRLRSWALLRKAGILDRAQGPLCLEGG
jgi:hypothetical protein